MSEPIDILGMGADGPSGLSPIARSRLAAATFLAGGRRHLGLVNPAVESFEIRDNVAELVERLRVRRVDERCVVLASGDPLFYGIGHRIGLELGSDQIRVEPALSSMQLAFARAGLSWQDAKLASVHGRGLASTLLPLLGSPRIGLFTQDGSSPSKVAGFFLDRGLDDYATWVGERLGTSEERVTRLPMAELPGKSFDDLNYLILERAGSTEPKIDRGPTMPDDRFARPSTGPVLLTHEDIRAVTLSRFREVPDGPIWDIGAGLGGVSIDLARAFRVSEVVAFERSERQRAYLVENRRRFATYNLRVVGGEAPDCLVGEDRPAAIFLGGTGGRLDPILDLVFDRLVERGVLVANFVGLENLARFRDRVEVQGWPIDLAQVQINQGRPLAGLTTLVPLRPVWIVRTCRVKPGTSETSAFSRSDGKNGFPENNVGPEGGDPTLQ